MEIGCNLREPTLCELKKTGTSIIRELVWSPSQETHRLSVDETKLQHKGIWLFCGEQNKLSCGPFLCREKEEIMVMIWQKYRAQLKQCLMLLIRQYRKQGIMGQQFQMSSFTKDKQWTLTWHIKPTMCCNIRVITPLFVKWSHIGEFHCGCEDKLLVCPWKQDT